MKKLFLLVAGVIILFAVTFVSCKKADTTSPQSSGAQSAQTHVRGPVVVTPHYGTWDGNLTVDICCEPSSILCYIEVTGGADGIYNIGDYVNNSTGDQTIFMSGSYTESSTVSHGNTYYTTSVALSSGTSYPKAFSAVQKDLGF